MTDTTINQGPEPQLRLRALVLDADEMRRLELSKVLSDQGLRVFGCGNIEQGRQVFDEHALVIAPLNGDSQAVVDFVHWLRTRSGRTQPYVLGVGEYHGPASEWHGFNEFVTAPLDVAKVRNCVDAARRWHGWTAEIALAPRPPVAPPKLVRSSAAVSEFTTKPPTALPEVESPFDWDAAVSGASLVAKPEPTLAPTPLHALPASVSPALAEVGQTPINESLHQQINEASPFGLLLLDDAANLIYANPQHRAVLGITVEEAGGIAAWLEAGCAVEPQMLKSTLDTWWERVWRRHLPLVLTMRSAESLLKEIEFRPSRLPDERLLVAIFDVTDARREEESMRTSEARFRNLFLQMPSRVVVVNAAGNITDASSAFEQLVGCSRLDMRRMGMDQFFPDDDLVRMRQETFSARQGQRVPPFPVQLKPRQGAAVPLVCTISVVKNSSGAPVFTAFYFQENAPAPDALVALPEPPAEPSRLLGAQLDLVLALSADSVILEHLPSRDFHTLLPETSLAGQPFAEALPTLAGSLPLGDMIAELEETLTGEVRCVFKVRIQPEDAPSFCEARLMLLSAPDTVASERQFGLVIRNLSRSVTATEVDTPAAPVPAPVASAPPSGIDPTLSVISLLQQAVLVTNEKGRICELNPAAETLFGYARMELLNAGLYKIFQPDQPKEFALKISAEINLRRCWIGETTYVRKDGTTGDAHIELVPYEDGSRHGFMGFVRNLPKPDPATPVPPPIATTDTPLAPPAVPPRPGSVVTLHRARNDLQVLSSLLSMQAADLGINEGTRQALQAGKDRVSAVALVYRLLDGTTGMVDFSKFTQEMSLQILRSHQIADERVTVVSSSESQPVPQKLGITLGLILQELLNSLLIHSFPKPAKGRIQVSLRLSGHEGVLSLTDNAPFQNSLTLETRTKGFGWQIVEALCQQLNGDLQVLSDLENEITLRFRHDSSVSPAPADH